MQQLTTPVHGRDAARLSAYESLGFTPSELCELIGTIKDIARDSQPYEGDKIFIHVAKLRKLLHLNPVGTEETEGKP